MNANDVKILHRDEYSASIVAESPYVIELTALEKAVKEIYADYYFIDRLNIKELYWKDTFEEYFKKLYFRNEDGSPRYDILTTEDYLGMADLDHQYYSLRKFVIMFLDEHLCKDGYPYQYVIIDMM